MGNDRSKTASDEKHGIIGNRLLSLLDNQNNTEKEDADTSCDSFFFYCHISVLGVMETQLQSVSECSVEMCNWVKELLGHEPADKSSY